MNEKKERVSVKLSRDSVLGITAYKSLLFKMPPEDVPVSYSFIIEKAHNEIKDFYDQIDWSRINSKQTFIPGVSDNNDSFIQGVNTKLAFNTDEYNGLRSLQHIMQTNFFSGRVYLSFTIKCLLFAAILNQHDTLKDYFI